MITITLFGPADPYGWLISLFTWSKYCHAGVIVPDANGVTSYYEMLFSGMRKWKGCIPPRAQARLTGIEGAWAHRWLEARLNSTPYGIGDVVGVAQDMVGLGGHGDRGGMMCSEMVVKLVQDALAAGQSTGLGRAFDVAFRDAEAHKVSPKALGKMLCI